MLTTIPRKPSPASLTKLGPSIRTPRFLSIRLANGMRTRPPMRNRVRFNWTGLNSPATSLSAISIVLKNSVASAINR